MSKQPLKKLNLSKYAFLDWLKGDIYAWLNCNENFLNASKEDENLRKLSLWRYEENDFEEKDFNLNRYGFEGYEDYLKKNLDKDIPDSIKSGIQVGEYSEIWAKNKFQNFNFIKINNFSNEKNSIKTKKIIVNAINKNENLVIFEGSFQYNDFTIRTDILVIENKNIKIIEVKATTSPKKVFLFDILFQKLILDNQDYLNNTKISYSFLILNNEYKHKKKYSLKEVSEKIFLNINYVFSGKSLSYKKIVDSSGNKFKINWSHSNNSYWFNNLLNWENLNSSPIFEKKYVYKVLKGKVIEKYDSRSKNFTFSINDFWKTDLFKFFKNNLDEILFKIKKIQLLDEPPKLEFTKKNRDFMNTNYENWALKKSGAFDDKNKFSIFNIKGKVIDWEKKCNLFLSGKKYLEDLEIKDFFSKKINVENKTKEDLFIEWKNNFELNKNNNLFDAFIQWFFYDKDFFYLNKKKIDEILSDYKNTPIYMYDFETANLPIPQTEGASPYEQVVYQFSVHVILNSDDFDFKTMKNIIHYEWLAEDRESFYIKSWKEFIKPFIKHGKGKYVAWNMSFEKNCIKNRQKDFLTKEENKILDNIYFETIDLMIPFKNKYYYHKELSGSYSIKFVGPHFVGKNEINYDNLPLVKKGDQSAAIAKKWLRNNSLDSDIEWKQSRNGMLKYCEYDTLLMVAILQKLFERRNND